MLCRSEKGEKTVVKCNKFESTNCNNALYNDNKSVEV